MVGEAAAWLEASLLARTLRGGVWLYPLVNLAHLLGIALLFGAVSVLDLRLVGLWRRVPLGGLAEATIPVAVAGFVLAVLSGAAMVTVQARDYAANPFLWAKFGAVALAGLNALLLHRSRAWAEAGGAQGAGSRRLALAGLASLACWLAAVAAGRMIAYW